MKDFYCNQILSGNINVEPVFETALVLAFHHTDPYFEHHVVIISKQHIESLSTDEVMNPQLAVDFIAAIRHVTKLIEEQFGGCRVSSNVGAYQTTKHLHWYVHAGKRLRNEDGSPIMDHPV